VLRKFNIQHFLIYKSEKELHIILCQLFSCLQVELANEIGSISSTYQTE